MALVVQFNFAEPLPLRQLYVEMVHGGAATITFFGENPDTFSDQLVVLSLQITLVVTCYYRPYICGISTDNDITLELKYQPITDISVGL